MEITNELLAAYAQNNVSDTERTLVRQYLTAHPDHLETVMMMMDEDFELGLDEDSEYDTISQSLESSFSDICLSAAAFAPKIVLMKKIETKEHTNRISFNKNIDDLLNELDL